MAIATVYDVLNGEWERLGATPAAVAHLDRWKMTEPILAGYRTPGEVVAAIVAGRCWGQPNPRLTALLALAADDLFAVRAALQAVLPGLRAEPLRRNRDRRALLGPGDDSGDVSAELVAAAWVVICTQTGTRLADPENTVIRAAAEKVRSVRRAEARTRARTVALSDTAPWRMVELADARSAAEQVLLGLIDAVTAGTVTARQAQLLYATRVKRITGRECGGPWGMTPGQVFHAIEMAEAAITRRMA